MNYPDKIIGEIEIHSVEGIRECFEHGLSPNEIFRGEPLINELTSEYLRSSRFKHCVRAFVDHGLDFQDEILLSVLLDDAQALDRQLGENPAAANNRYTLRSAFTPLYEASLLHVCAEFNHLSCARVLVNYKAGFNVQAGIDENGFGGQTPIFHTVNQILNHGAEMLNFLLPRAELQITLAGLIWGKGYPWETLIPAVNPISYAMMGLLPQMHRKESDISKTVMLLLKAAYGIEYIPPNIPNEYLKNR